MAFPTLQLRMPPLWDKDWSPSEDMPTGEAGLLKVQGRLASALRLVDNQSLTPARAAWLHLWSRAFNICEMMWSAIERENAVLLNALIRLETELGLHVFAIAEPVMARRRATRGFTVEARLNGYIAWCLKNDLKQAYETFSHLEDLYDPRPGRELARSLGSTRDAWERYFGEIEVLGDPEAEAQRDSGEAELRREIAQLERLLSDFRLIEWVTRIDQLGRGNHTLFRVFEDADRSVWDHVRGLKLGPMYAAFSKGSSVLHGSGAAAHLLIQDDACIPLFGDLRREAPTTLHQQTALVGLVASTIESLGRLA